MLLGSSAATHPHEPEVAPTRPALGVRRVSQPPVPSPRQRWVGSAGGRKPGPGQQLAARGKFLQAGSTSEQAASFHLGVAATAPGGQHLHDLTPGHSMEPGGVGMALAPRPWQSPRGNKERTRSKSKPLATQAQGDVSHFQSSCPSPRVVA